MHFTSKALAWAAMASAAAAATKRTLTPDFTVTLQAFQGNSCTDYTNTTTQDLVLGCDAANNTFPFQFSFGIFSVADKFKDQVAEHSIGGFYGEHCDTPNRQGYYYVPLEVGPQCQELGTLDLGVVQSFNLIEGPPI